MRLVSKAEQPAVSRVTHIVRVHTADGGAYVNTATENIEIQPKSGQIQHELMCREVQHEVKK